MVAQHGFLLADEPRVHVVAPTGRRATADRLVDRVVSPHGPQVTHRSRPRVESTVFSVRVAWHALAMLAVNRYVHQPGRFAL